MFTLIGNKMYELEEETTFKTYDTIINRSIETSQNLVMTVDALVFEKAIGGGFSILEEKKEN